MGIFAVLSISCSDNSSSADEDSFDASKVCPTEGLNRYNEPMRGTFTDERDGQVYKYTTIGEQVWMAENLKFDAPYSLCYDKIEGFCDTFGRFYSLHIDGEDFGLFDQALMDTICPAGWHVPNVDEWNVLAYNMGGASIANSRLKSAGEFGYTYTPGTDDCIFNSLPAGYSLLDGSHDSDNLYAVYWTSTAYTSSLSYTCIIDRSDFRFGRNHPKMSIRCIKDSL